jgi:hypothetical protein
MFTRTEIQKECDLEDMVIKDIEAVEKGLTFLSHQPPANGNFIDVLAVDAGGVLVVMELKVEGEDEMLIQALDYYDYVYSNLDRLAKEFKEFKGVRVNTEEDPRIMLIASSFTDRLKRAARHVEPDIKLVEYSCLDVRGGGRDLFCREVPNESEGGFVASVPLERAFSYIANDKVRALSLEVHAQLLGIGADIEAVPKETCVRYKWKNRRLGGIYMRRGFFWVGWDWGSDEWSEIKVATTKDWKSNQSRVLKGFARRYREVGGS